MIDISNIDVDKKDVKQIKAYWMMNTENEKQFLYDIVANKRGSLDVS